MQRSSWHCEWGNKSYKTLLVVDLFGFPEESHCFGLLLLYPCGYSAFGGAWGYFKGTMLIFLELNQSKWSTVRLLILHAVHVTLANLPSYLHQPISRLSVEHRKTSVLELSPVSNSECTTKGLLLPVHCGKQAGWKILQKRVDLFLPTVCSLTTERVSLLFTENSFIPFFLFFFFFHQCLVWF